MNAGFSNLDTLRKQLLAATLKNDPRFDAIILALGQGVAGQFATFCNRKFQRAVGDQMILPADHCQFVLERYPIEAVTAIDLKMTEADGFVAQVVNNFVTTIDQKSGIVNCPDGADAGPWYAQVRFTYTGGYFWETLEPDDPAFPSVLPDGATALPSELFTAWVLQCKHIWGMTDKLGTDLLKDGAAKSLRFPEEFAPTVAKTLGQYTRYNLT